ncbi:MAG: hypothetical protein HN712_24190 [Gemmatimonadetes bacterium]|jgi:hypothetical protein|nr:hypothetical protein [Gemmatimonadota bacterium]MBT6150008.1 hypothetical protein [Gemmatimonadota bacterium]MBT7863438.1 hypothetical protein [Gemmatimonadota bacterium]
MTETDRIISWRPHRWALATYLILGGLRLVRPLDVEEAIALTRTDLGFGDWLHFGYSPGYLLILDLWSGLTTSPAWLHALGWVCGLLALGLAPRVLRGLGGVHASAGAMWFLCCSPFVVDHLVRVTPSSLALLTIVGSSLCFLEYLRAGDRTWLGGWTLFSLGALSLHGGLYVLPLLQSACMLASRERTHARQQDWWIAQIAPLGLFIYLFADPLSRFLQLRLTQVAAPAQVLEGFGRIVEGVTLSGAIGAAALILFLVVSGLRVQTGNRRDPRRLLSWIGWLIPGAIWLLWLPYPFYALIAAPFLAAIISGGVRSYPQWGRQVLWTAIFMLYAWGHVTVLR